MGVWTQKDYRPGDEKGEKIEVVTLRAQLKKIYGQNPEKIRTLTVIISTPVYFPTEGEHLPISQSHARRAV